MLALVQCSMEPLLCACNVVQMDCVRIEETGVYIFHTVSNIVYETVTGVKRGAGGIFGVSYHWHSLKIYVDGRRVVGTSPVKNCTMSLLNCSTCSVGISCINLLNHLKLQWHSSSDSIHQGLPCPCVAFSRAAVGTVSWGVFPSASSLKTLVCLDPTNSIWFYQLNLLFCEIFF